VRARVHMLHLWCRPSGQQFLEENWRRKFRSPELQDSFDQDCMLSINVNFQESWSNLDRLRRWCPSVLIPESSGQCLSQCSINRGWSRRVCIMQCPISVEQACGMLICNLFLPGLRPYFYLSLVRKAWQPVYVILLGFPVSFSFFFCFLANLWITSVLWKNCELCAY